MRLTTKQPAPTFRTLDVYGTVIDLKQLRGKNVYVAFERNAGCPVCNLRVHEMLKSASELTRAAEILFIYESSPEKMRDYLGENKYPFHFIADPEHKLYDLFAIEKSWAKMMTSIFNGLIPKAKAGQKLFKTRISQDGHTNTIPAEFIINEDGINDR